jgi:RNA methyltransferase, TrmH family
MLTKNKAKLIHSLLLKKNRTDNQMFLVEGEKNLLEVLTSKSRLIELVITKKFAETYTNLLTNFRYEIAEEDELSKIGSLDTNNAGIAILPIKKPAFEHIEKENLVLVLDGVNDPGNLGTIIRLADWYGIKHVICSLNTVDVYNPKVIMSTKGSFLRVNVHYVSLEHYLTIVDNIKLVGTFMDGQNVHHFKFPQNTHLIMGSESHGITETIEKLISNKINIPGIGKAESLNVAIATAICLDNYFRMKA